MMVLDVRFEVLAQILDTGGQKRDLHFGRSAIVLGTSVGTDNFPLTGRHEGHQKTLTFPLSFRCQEKYHSNPTSYKPPCKNGVRTGISLAGWTLGRAHRALEGPTADVIDLLPHRA